MTIDDLNISEFNVDQPTFQQILAEVRDDIASVLSVKKCGMIGNTLFLTMLLSLSESPYNFIADESPCPIEITLPVQKKASIKEIHISESQSQLNGVLDNLSHLNDSWDGGSAQNPTYEALKSAYFFVEHMDSEILSKCSIFPSNDAGIYLRGKFQDCKMTIYFKSGFMTYIVKGESLGKLSASVPVNANSVEYLYTGLKDYV
ncbi:MAG: hypothetical protein MJZ11_12405 [Lachnospiraceae bacterium]|nr:hypothetical protein [Lachnospiraceae bacterium]